MSKISATNGVVQTLTTKGDIEVYSTTPTRLPVGTNGQFLVADSTQTTGLKWSLSDNYSPSISTPAFASTMTPTIAGFDLIRVSMTGNITTFNLTGGADGQRVIVEFIQDATGGRTVSFGTSIRFGTDITSVTLSTTASKTDRVGFIYNATASKYDVVAYVRGF